MTEPPRGATTEPTARKPGPPTVLIVGGGFAGVYCAKRLEKLLRDRAVKLVVVSPLDHAVYLPLLPEVATGVIEPRHLAISLHRVLHSSRVVLGEVTAIDLDGQTALVRELDGSSTAISWDRLVLTPGAGVSAPHLPGLREHAIGFKTLAQAAYLRDHVLRQLTVADASGHERAASSTFVIIGGGYTGTELAAQMQWFTLRAVKRYRNLKTTDLRWVLLEMGPQLMAQLNSHLGVEALKHLRRRGIEVRLSTAAEAIGDDEVTLSNGETIRTTTVVWCGGTQPLDVTLHLGLSTVRGGILVDATLRVPERPNIFAFGDSASVPDLTRPGEFCPQTAQHAVRQGERAARNVAATLGVGNLVDYWHRDLGFVVDLGGWYGVADPFHIPLTGIAAKVVTKGYHAYALPTVTNRLRVLADWALNLITPNQLVELDFVPSDLAGIHPPSVMD